MPDQPIPAGGAGQSAAPVITLTTPAGDLAEVHRFGGQVTRWRTAGGDEVLYLSPRAVLDGSAPIRGGIPISFPQFAELGPGPRHGFARTQQWTALSADAPSSECRLALVDDPATRAVWPHRFSAELEVRLDDGLEVRLTVRNNGDEVLQFTCALHTYLRVEEVRQVEVTGLDGVVYQERRGAAAALQQGPVRLAGETDRVYVDAPAQVQVRDSAAGRTLLLESEGFGDLVIWNPGPLAAAAVADLGEDQFSRFVCVEPARIIRPVRVEPGQSWTGRQRLRVQR